MQGENLKSRPQADEFQAAELKAAELKAAELQEGGAQVAGVSDNFHNFNYAKILNEYPPKEMNKKLGINKLDPEFMDKINDLLNNNGISLQEFINSIFPRAAEPQAAKYGVAGADGADSQAAGAGVAEFQVAGNGSKGNDLGRYIDNETGERIFLDDGENEHERTLELYGSVGKKLAELSRLLSKDAILFSYLYPIFEKVEGLRPYRYNIHDGRSLNEREENQFLTKLKNELHEAYPHFEQNPVYEFTDKRTGVKTLVRLIRDALLDEVTDVSGYSTGQSEQTVTDATLYRRRLFLDAGNLILDIKRLSERNDQLGNYLQEIFEEFEFVQLTRYRFDPYTGSAINHEEERFLFRLLTDPSGQIERNDFNNSVSIQEMRLDK